MKTFYDIVLLGVVVGANGLKFTPLIRGANHRSSGQPGHSPFHRASLEWALLMGAGEVYSIVIGLAATKFSADLNRVFID